MHRMLISVACASLWPALASAQITPAREGPGDPPAPARPRLTGPAGTPQSPAGFVSVQVNVDDQGRDILNDAANEPSIAVDPTAPNRMAIGWRQFDSVESSFRQAGYAWTNDGGRHWHFDGVLEPGTFGSDPSLESDSAGNFYYMTLHDTFRCFLFRSSDRGRSWQGGVYAQGGDKEWITVDKSRGIGDGNLYQAWSVGGAVGNRSVDGGLSFSQERSFLVGVWGTLAVGPDGELYAGSFDSVARSDDAQDPEVEQFWFDEVPIHLGVGPAIDRPPNGGLMGQAWVDVDRSAGPARGHVYIAATGRLPDDRISMRFIRSVDGGKTWSDPVNPTGVPDEFNGWLWFGTMSVAPNGRIDVVWNQTVNQEGSVSETRYTYSADTGQTWAPPQVLSPPWNSQIGWPNNNKIGDYYDMQSDLVGVDLAYAATFTGGQDVYYLRIGDYDCNGNGVGDTEDLASGAVQDCDGDGIPDSCEIAAGAEADSDEDGVPDSCECYADFNFDGSLDLFDFLNFINQFDSENPRTDCDHDGDFTLFDFLCFVNAFNAGC